MLKQKVDSLWQDIPFDFMRDSLDLKRYNLFAEWVVRVPYAPLLKKAKQRKSSVIQ